jgi:hypothetical protein
MECGELSPLSLVAERRFFALRRYAVALRRYAVALRLYGFTAERHNGSTAEPSLRDK